MPRRVSLPAADELFRSTSGSAVQPTNPQQNTNGGKNADRNADRNTDRSADKGGAARRDVGSPASTPASGDVAGSDAPEHATAPEGGAAENEREAAPSESRTEAGAREHDGPGSRRAVPEQGKGRRDPAEPARPGGSRAAAKGRQAAAGAAPRRPRNARRPSGRERHDEKITVYVSAEELMDLEHARLVLRGEHGLAVDRGRIVREAVAVVLADLESRGEASILVRRLRSG
ncbi:hypothetical protein [Streptomyces sp. NPDC005438]|uniref:hypothetical protein n=1 Tax=Streptomyces sp. NPDC005438 TaxID=3156880 RepID=UPI0033B67751